jgi:uncharacterized protein
MNYRAPFWLPGGNLQTIWAAVCAQSTPHGVTPCFERARWTTPDEDFIDVDWMVACGHASPNRDGNASLGANTVSRKTLLVLFHGLEGSSSSHYALAFAAFAQQRRLGFAVPHFRGCSGELNLAPRAYHSGDHEEVAWILSRLKSEWQVSGGQDLVAVGVSLGGNALLRWAQEAGSSASKVVRAIAAVSAPIDLSASGLAIGRGFNRQVYTRMFLNTMKPRALRKLAQFPGLFDRERLLAARDLYEFDDVFTAPLHGFKGTKDYWSRCAAKPHLGDMRLPTLVLNAQNDPFVPAASLPGTAEVGSNVTLWQPRDGGHVGFPSGRLPSHVHAMPAAVGQWLLAA